MLLRPTIGLPHWLLVGPGLEATKHSRRRVLLTVRGNQKKMLRIHFLRTTRARTPVGLAMKCIMEYEGSSIPTVYCKLRTSTTGSDSIYTPCWGKAEPRSCTMVFSLSMQLHPRSSDLPSTTGLPTSGSFLPSLRTISHGRIEKSEQKSAWRKLSRRLLQVAV